MLVPAFSGVMTGSIWSARGFTQVIDRLVEQPIFWGTLPRGHKQETGLSVLSFLNLSSSRETTVLLSVVFLGPLNNKNWGEKPSGPWV